MTDASNEEAELDSADDVTETIASLTDDILPALTARLRASSLAEIEIRSDGWRVRLRREIRPVERGVAPGHGGAPALSALATLPPAAGPAEARSPAVGYFTPSRDLAVGQVVRAGDALGVVDMLGVVQEVPAPRDGLVTRLLAETGQAVEYGQALVEVDPVGSTAQPAPDVAGTAGLPTSNAAAD